MLFMFIDRIRPPGPAGQLAVGEDPVRDQHEEVELQPAADRPHPV